MNRVDQMLIIISALRAKMQRKALVLVLDGSSEHGAHVGNKFCRFVKGIWLHRKNPEIRFFFGIDLFFFICAHHVLS